MKEEETSSKVAVSARPEKNPIQPEPTPAELTASGHWAETQVIASIKEATFRKNDPRLVLNGQETRETQQIGGVFHPVKTAQGELIVPKPSKRSRLRRLLGYLSS